MPRLDPILYTPGFEYWLKILMPRLEGGTMLWLGFCSSIQSSIPIWRYSQRVGCSIQEWEETALYNVTWISVIWPIFIATRTTMGSQPCTSPVEETTPGPLPGSDVTQLSTPSMLWMRRVALHWWRRLPLAILTAWEPCWPFLGFNSALKMDWDGGLRKLQGGVFEKWYI